MAFVSHVTLFRPDVIAAFRQKPKQNKHYKLPPEEHVNPWLQKKPVTPQTVPTLPANAQPQSNSQWRTSPCCVVM